MRYTFSLLLCFASPSAANASVARFQDFPAPLYRGHVAPVLISSREDREFRTMLSEASGRRPNFAGHYILTSWGCGSPCIMTVAIDVRTGRTSWLPVTLCCWPAGIDDPRQFRPDSRLLILRGQRNETGPNATWSYLIDDRGFHLLPALLARKDAPPAASGPTH